MALFSVSAPSAQPRSSARSGEGILACYTALRDARILQGRARKSQVGEVLRSYEVCDWLRRARLQQAACPSARCCCGGAWARRVDGPALAALTHGGDDNPLSPCIARPMRLRWAPCRKLNWERDALAGCLRNRLVGCGSACVVVAHINCVSYITVGSGVCCSSSRSPSSPPQQGHFFGSAILSYLPIFRLKTLVYLLLSIFS